MDNLRWIEAGLSVFLFNGVGLLLLAYLAKRSLDGLDGRLDTLSEKIERLIEGRMELVTREDFRPSIARIHDKIDHLEAEHAEICNRVSLLEGRLAAPLMGKAGK